MATRKSVRKGRPDRMGARPKSQPRRALALRWLREATAPAAISGHEAEAVTWFAAEARKLGASVRVDRLGSCLATLPGSQRGRSRRKLLLSAHADSVGLLVAGITPKGFLRVVPVGGVDPRILPAQDVWVHGRKVLPGVFGSVPPHFQSPLDQRQAYAYEDLFVDVGMNAAQVRRVVAVGDPVSLCGPVVELLHGRVSGRAMDDRAGLVAELLALEALARDRPLWDVVFVAGVMEETGRVCSGALAAAEAERPDAAIAIDVSHGDMPGLEEWQAFALGKGPVLAIGPNVHPAMFRALHDVATRARVPVQVEPCPRSTGTEGMDLQVAGEGVPTAVMGTPLRYMHSAVETLDLADLLATADLLARFARSLNKPIALEGET